MYLMYIISALTEIKYDNTYKLCTYNNVSFIITNILTSSLTVLNKNTLQFPDNVVSNLTTSRMDHEANGT
jgi:hypothetical protein